MGLTETIITSLVTSGGTSFVLAKLWFEHKLQSSRIELEGETRKQVEKILGDQASQRQYELEAKKRLYSAVGPLRFQLLLACRDLSNRVSGHGRAEYIFDIDKYYARSFIYRVLRPLALFELIERQMSEADFSVDPIGKKLLQFHSAASNIFCGSDLVEGHPLKDMQTQKEHIFHSNISILASILIKTEGNKERCMRYDEFVDFSFSQSNGEKLEPLRSMFSVFTPTKRPLLWVRLIAYCNLCNQLINTMGTEIGFEQRKLEIANRLRLTENAEILNEIDAYVQRCERAAAAQL